MIPIHPVQQAMHCRPEWVHFNHLLSYCVRTLTSGSGSPSEAGADVESSRCSRKDCLFSATRL
jgi:hypothetical protein